MHSTAAILLAAGQSTRMGVPNKLLLPIANQPMVRHVATQYRLAIDGPICVVTGHAATDVEAALEGLDVEIVYNPDHATGQQTSVACGLRHVPEADVLLIGLGDQPLLQQADINALLDAHSTADPNKVSIPDQGGQRGNPIVIPHSLRQRLTADPDRPGCMRFTRDNPHLVQRLPFEAPGYFADIDTPTDYETLCARLETTL